MALGTREVDLKGQVAIVTGGGRGLGRAMAYALAIAGAKVAVVARSEPQLGETVDLIHQAGGQVLAVPTDITDRTAVEQMVQRVQNELGVVDILVNNAGVTGVPGPIWEADPDDWRHTFDVNMYGVFLCSKTVLKGMVERQRGRIINVASGAAINPITYGSGYSVSKAAVLRLTECIVADAKEHGIIAFAIDPGSVRTAMTEYLIESEEGRTYLPWYRQLILGGGDVPPERSANLVTLLASGKMDSLSGRFIRVSDNIEQLLHQTGRIAQDDLYTLRLRTL